MVADVCRDFGVDSAGHRENSRTMLRNVAAPHGGYGLAQRPMEPQECRPMKQAGRVGRGGNRQGRRNGVGGTKRGWKPALVNPPGLMC